MNTIKKITTKNNKPMENLHLGDIFKHKDSYFMRTDGREEDLFICVCLETGEVGYFDPKDKVYQTYTAEITLKEK